MRFVGIDTNILLRLIVNDDEAQRAQVLKFGSQLNKDYQGFVSLVTLLEMDWALTSQYGYSRRQSAEAIHNLARIRGIEIEKQPVAIRALIMAEERNADFADALIAELAREAGCEVTMTLDRKAASRIPGMELLA